MDANRTPAERIDRPGRLLSQLARVSGAYMARGLQPLGITAAQYPYLMVLYRRDGLSQEELAADLRIDKAAAKRAIDPLVAAGLVRRERNPDDARAYRLSATERALALRPAIQALLDRWEGALTSGFTDAERERLLDSLNRMARNAVDAMRPLAKNPPKEKDPRHA